MTLTTENLGNARDVDAVTLDEILLPDSFGGFAILSASEDEFIQAGALWEPSEKCAAFLRSHHSDPWVLEYREDERHFQAVGPVTLEQARQAFQSYLAGRRDWRSNFVWSEIFLT